MRTSIRNTCLMAVIPCGLMACTPDRPHTLVTIADAREHPARLIDRGEPGDSVGDMLVFDQPLLDGDGNRIGTNNGTCIRTRPGYSFQCHWTLNLANGSIHVTGREFDRGTSLISIVGGTGEYTSIMGEMESTNNGDGTFSQILHYRKYTATGAGSG